MQVDENRHGRYCEGIAEKKRGIEDEEADQSVIADRSRILDRYPQECNQGVADWL